MYVCIGNEDSKSFLSPSQAEGDRATYDFQAASQSTFEGWRLFLYFMYVCINGKVYIYMCVCDV
jgi:hypothetical protein